MTIFLVFVAVAVVGAVALLTVGRGRSGGAEATDIPGLVEPVPSLPAILLPDDPQPDDVGRIRFALGLRGYRMDQVDEVLDRLTQALEERDAVICELRRELDARS